MKHALVDPSLPLTQRTPDASDDTEWQSQSPDDESLDELAKRSAHAAQDLAWHSSQTDDVTAGRKDDPEQCERHKQLNELLDDGHRSPSLSSGPSP